MACLVTEVDDFVHVVLFPRIGYQVEPCSRVVRTQSQGFLYKWFDSVSWELVSLIIGGADKIHLRVLWTEWKDLLDE